MNKKKSVISFIPAEAQFVLRVKQTSVTINSFFSSPVVKDCFQLNQIEPIWKSIDSLTSRNYKTSEVLLKNTSYICIDSAGNYLILIDLNKKTNEHFIDQFLVNSTGLRKIERFKEGHKAFFPQPGKPIYYFVKHGLFGVSSNEKFILSSIQHGQAEISEELILKWDTETNSDLAIWGLKGSEQKIISHFQSQPFIGKWNDGSIVSSSIEIDFDNEKIQCNGSILVDSANSRLPVFFKTPNPLSIYFYQADTGFYENQFYSLQIKDTMNTFQPVSFVYSSFPDSGGACNSLLVSQSSIALSLFQKISIDTSVQIIPMADENIKQIALLDIATCKRILPIIPFTNDSAKLFATIYNGYLFIATSTETILLYAPYYPGKNFIKKKLEGAVILYTNYMRKYSKPYLMESIYRATNEKTISFTSEIKPINGTK